VRLSAAIAVVVALSVAFVGRAEGQSIGTSRGILCGRTDDPYSWAVLARLRMELDNGAATYIVTEPKFLPDGSKLFVCGINEGTGAEVCWSEPAGEVSFRVRRTLAGPPQRTLRLAPKSGTLAYAEPFSASEGDDGCFLRSGKDALAGAPVVVANFVGGRTYVVTTTSDLVVAAYVPRDLKAVVGLLQARTPEEIERHSRDILVGGE
jgi:hypothetical protein